MDKGTVRSLKTASEIALATGQPTDSEVGGLEFLMESFVEWLQRAAAGDDDCA